MPILSGSNKSSVCSGTLTGVYLDKIPFLPIHRTVETKNPVGGLKKLREGSSTLRVEKDNAEYGFRFSISRGIATISVITYEIPEAGHPIPPRVTRIGEVVGGSLKNPENLANTIKEFNRIEAIDALRNLKSGNYILLEMSTDLELCFNWRNDLSIVLWAPDSNAWKWRTEIKGHGVRREHKRQKYIKRGEWVT